MGKIIDIIEELAKDNPKARRVTMRIYADALRQYIEASENVGRNGSICAHPRTGTPIENPYLKVQKEQGKILDRMKTLKSDRVFDLLTAAEGSGDGE